PACENGGHFTLFGYTTCPNYDAGIKTVYVPIFENKTIYRRIEFYLTRAGIKAIETNTPYKGISDRTKADRELTGTIIAFKKGIVNRNQLNEVREAETVLTVGVVWRDLRTGEVLSHPRVGPAQQPPPFLQLPDLAPGVSAVPTNPVNPP